MVPNGTHSSSKFSSPLLIKRETTSFGGHTIYKATDRMILMAEAETFDQAFAGKVFCTSQAHASCFLQQVRPCFRNEKLILLTVYIHIDTYI